MRQILVAMMVARPRSQVVSGVIDIFRFPLFCPPRARAGRWLGLWLLVFCFLPAAANAVPLTGPRLKTALARPTNRSWTELPLRQVLDQLCAAHRISVFLDRRVNPGQETSLDALRLSLGETLQKLASLVNTEMVQFGSIVYIGPEATARWLPTVAAARREEVRAMPDRGRAMLTSKSMRWDDLATPRQLVQALADETGVPIGPIEAIPHDLWAAAELPRATPVDRLTLILSQFDKTFTVATDTTGKPRLVIVDIPAELKTEAFPPSRLGGMPKTPSQKSLQKSAQKSSQKSSSQQAAASPPINLDRLRIKRFAVKEKPVGLVIKYLARQWNLTLELDRQQLDEKLQQRITVTEENVTVPKLINAVLSPAGLQGKLDQKTGILKIEPR